MKKLANASTVALIGLFSVSCAEKATQDECKKMCENLGRLRDDINTSTEKERIAKVEQSFKKEEKRLKDWLAKDLKGWDDELAGKLAELKKAKEKKALTEEYEKKKKATGEQHMPGIKELVPKKKEAIEEAKKKAKASKAAWDKAIDECVAAALKEGVSKELAECRIKAESKDKYWNLCR